MWSKKMKLRRTAARAKNLSAVMLLALAATACSTMPDREPEAPPLPTTWQDAPIGAEVSLAEWWRKFNDPDLTRLVAEALANGPSLQLAASRVEEARAQSRATIGQYLPELSLSGQGQYSRQIDGGDAGSSQTGEEFATASYGPQVSWEVPLWGRVDAARTGARANEQIAAADYRAARVALAADTAQAYVDLRAANASRIALEQSVVAADELTRILGISVGAGFASEAEAADARRLAESTRARLPGLVIEARRAENALAVLRGIAPGTEDAATRALYAEQRPVPSLPLTEAPAAPADLLRLRPDVARAEAQALLSASGVANARTDLLPRLNLTGGLTATETLLGVSLTGDGISANATPIISIPLFDWGVRLARVRQSNAQFDQALIQYRQTVTQAVAEASLALVSLDQGSRRLQSSRTAEEAAEVTLRGTRAAYEAGIQSLTDRLRAQQQVIDANLSRIEAERAQASAAISTFRAFGGGAV